MAASPPLFTAAFRRKLTELPPRERHDWLSSLAATLASAEPADPARAGELREVARACRLELVAGIQRQLGPFDDRILRAVLEVPRERFVRPADIGRSADDTPLPLDDAGLATISAPHAYCLSYRLLDLGPGDVVAELGSGSGYGAALGAFLVGARGRVVTFEIDPVLAAWARRTLAADANVDAVEADAVTSAARAGDGRAPEKVVVTFAIDAWPRPWIDALPEGGRIVAPITGGGSAQTLTLATRHGGRIVETEHGAVRYVRNRSGR